MFRIFCLSFCFLLNCLPITSAAHFISLGRDCQVAMHLIFYKHRNNAYPLDWVVSFNFYGIIEAFRDDFRYFLDPSFLVYKETIILNSYYQFGYNHFFPVIGHPIKEDIFALGTIVPNYLDHLSSVRTTQERRINRLLNLLSSKDKIVFIRTHSTPNEAKVFIELLKQKYPQADVLLVVVHERPDLIGEWNIPNVMNFYASERSNIKDWWTMNIWGKVFQEITNKINTQTHFPSKTN